MKVQSIFESILHVREGRKRTSFGVMTDEELASLRRDELQIHTQPLKTQLPNFREAVIAAALLFLATASTLLLYKRSDNDGSESKMLHSEVETTQTTDTMRVLITGFLPFRGSTESQLVSVKSSGGSTRLWS